MPTEVACDYFCGSTAEPAYVEAHWTYYKDEDQWICEYCMTKVGKEWR